MLRSAWFLAQNDLKHMLRARETLLWTFVMPVVFFFFIGSITKNFGSRGANGRDPLVVEKGTNAGFLAGALESHLGEAGFRVVLPDAVAPNDKTPRLAIPAAFTDSVLAGHKVKVTLTRNGEADEQSDYDRFRLQRAVFSLLGTLVAAGEVGRPTPEGIAIVSAAPKTVRLDVKSAGQRRVPPTGFEQAVPGTMVMFTLTLLLTSGAVLLMIERKEGLPDGCHPDLVILPPAHLLSGGPAYPKSPVARHAWLVVLLHRGMQTVLV